MIVMAVKETSNEEAGSESENHEMDEDRPVRLYVRDSRTRRLKVAFDLVDESVPYVRRIQGDFVPEDAGLWVDLVPDLPNIPGPDDDAVMLLVKHARDGEVRARLMDLGIAKVDWASASPGERRAVIAFIRANRLSDAAIREALTASDQRLRKAAVRLLRNSTKLLERERNIFNNKGFGAFAFKASTLDRAKRLLAVIEELLKLAKQEAAAAKEEQKDLFRSVSWLNEQARRVNDLALKPAQALSRARCTADHIRRLKGRVVPLTVARELVARAFRDLSEEDLIRGEVRRRSRPRKKSDR
jgi:hypothetical protein